MNILITICARGGSKGVKGKNIRLLAGEPLIAYTIATAKRWGKASNVVCSTDSEEIAEVARKFGAEVPFLRPADLASDTAGKIPAIRHALQACEKIYREKYDLVIDLDATSPIREVEDLNKCLEIFKEKNADVLLSVVESRKNPYFNMLELNEEGFAKISQTKGGERARILRRQDAPKVYDVNASVYVYSRSFLLDESNTTVLSTDKLAVHVMPEISSVDIDSELDFKFIEFLVEKGLVKL